MKVFRAPKSFQEHCLKQGRKGKAIGFVPTMGYLHDGHLSLVRRAKKECKWVAVSIFVNPTQFGPNEDYSRYPRDSAQDLKKLRELKVDCVFMPPAQAMYPKGFESWVAPSELEKVLCGKFRPGHFRGVTTVVCKLFHLVGPCTSYFGSKDYQQCLVIKKMVADLNLSVKVVQCPIVRESDGLALSSRNVYLSRRDREKALCLNRALVWAAAKAKAGERQAATLKSGMRSILEGNLSKLDYVEILDADSLLPRKPLSGRIVILVAGYVGRVRLIDNCVIITKS